MFQVKKATRKTTNHKSVSWACLSLFIMERVLSMMFKPVRDLPVKTGVHGGHLAQSSALKLPAVLALPKEVTHNPTITHHYQEYSPGTFAKCTTGFIQITQTLSSSSGTYLVAKELEEVGTKPMTRAPILRETGRSLLIPLNTLLHTCNVVQNLEGKYVVNFENK